MLKQSLSGTDEGPISAAQKKLVQDSFAAVAPNAEAAAGLFYGHLFELDPSLKALFKGDMKEQGRKLMAMLKIAVAGLDDLGKLVPAVQDLGRRHTAYGVKDEHYNTVAAALLWTLEQGLKDGFTPDVKAAWTAVYGVLAETMKSAPAAQPAPAPAAQPAPEHTMQNDTTGNNIYRQMVEDMPINVMVCDLENFCITYANKASFAAVKQLEEVVDIKADSLVGTCIDVFHKNPAHQRQLLADPKNLPHNALIQVGPETLDLLVTAVYDDSGKYTSAMLTWSVVTQKVKTDAQAAQLTQMVEGMPIGVMMCETENLEINYMNKFSTETLKTLQEHLPVKADDMIGQCIDVFHKDPAHQRKILSDPANLPHKALIQVGPETLDLLVTAIHDKDGSYMGPMLTWSVVTAKVKADAQAAQLTQMVEGMPIGVMMCSTENFEVNYMNKFSTETLKTLQEHLPVKVDDMIGQCIDVFHKDPAHQRKILSDAKNLPHKALISVGPETLDLLVTAIHDKEGNYMGPMLTWSVVTAKVKADAQAAQLTQMVEGMPIGVMMCETENFEMNYMNKFSTETLKTLQEHLPIKVDDMIGQSIDVFHQVPSHQRNILSDAKNLPHKALIQVGPETLDLLVTAIHDPSGKYMGPMLTWSVVTAKVKADAESARLVQMIEEMPINIMTLDPKDFTINYVNKTSLNTLKPLEHLLPVKLDQLLGTNLDIFHKVPSHQRKILSDPANLPHQAKIKLGDETLDLRVSAINGQDGEYIGPMLSWSVITGQVRMADDFETNVKGVVEIVSSSATEMQATAQSLSATSEETNRQATSVAAAAEEASTNVQTVASAAEELASSISEIGRQVEESSRIAGQAATQAKDTNSQVESLAAAANKIGEVVELISDIASQTNLLALNATIEAARAGEAGKGFAVVASEVKSLATQTAKATEEIAGQITAIQSATTDAVKAIKEISTTIESINDIAGNVASAVEEQGAATKEIAHSVQQASAGTTEVSSNISGVTQAASESGTSATQVLEAASELAKQSENLRGEVDKFLVQVRAS